MIERTPNGATVKVGLLVELTRDEQRELQELTSWSHRVMVARKPGFIHELYTAQGKISRILKRALDRAHRN